MITGKKLGLAKGDCVITSGGFVGVIMSDVHTFAPCCEIWGFAHEMGGTLATDLRKIPVAALKASPYYDSDPRSPIAKKVLAD